MLLPRRKQLSEKVEVDRVLGRSGRWGYTRPRPGWDSTRTPGTRGEGVLVFRRTRHRRDGVES